jgi:hypothetical protein
MSWFVLQKYRSAEIPTHPEIQHCLVSLGDKPSSFVGTKGWIGSQEVGLCLDNMMGVRFLLASLVNGCHEFLLLFVVCRWRLGLFSSALDLSFQARGEKYFITLSSTALPS